MSSLRVLVVDDEAPARAHLRALLENIKDVDVVGEASNAVEAKTLLEAAEHDVVFLDIRMPGMDGMEASEIFAQLPHSPAVIFTTAYEEYAPQAFEVGAADYLLKPVSPARLEKAVERVRARLEGMMVSAGGSARREGPEKGPAGAGQGAYPAGAIEYVTARRGNRMVLIAIDDVCFFRVEGETVYVFTPEDSFVAMSSSLEQLEDSLDSSRFFRSHRGYLVNLRYVAEVAPMFNRTYEMLMKDARRSRVPVSRRKAVELREILGF